MDLSSFRKNRTIILLLLPAITAFLMALIPTLNYQWPMSWDIYYHVHLAELYLEQGIVFWDPLTYAPYGRPIYYPPLFHFILASLSYIFKLDPFQVARFLQPILAFSVVLSFSYVGYRLYGLSVGVLSGFFIFYTMLFHRALLPIPETLAMVFLPLSVYYYYHSICCDHSRKLHSYRYAVLAGILLGLTLLTHALSAGMLALVIVLCTIILKYRSKKSVLKYFAIFWTAALIIASLWWAPLLLKYGFVFHNPLTNLLNLSGYLTTLFKTFGVLTLIFSLIGLFLFIKRRQGKDVIMLSWFLSLIIISNAYLLGFHILADRILNFAIFPAVIAAAMALTYMGTRLDRKWYGILVALVVIGALIFAFTSAATMKPLVSSPQQDVAEWFKVNGDKQKVVVSLTNGTDPVIVSIARQPVSTGGYQPGMVKVVDMEKYYFRTYQKSDLVNDNVGYFVIDWGTAPPYSEVVYESKGYKICKVEL
jgi:hypothetical protein